MTPDEYLAGILQRETVQHGILSPLWAVQTELTPLVTEWANGRLLNMHPSGSYAKGTCNASGTDIDLFISLDPATIETLEEIHSKLFNRLTERGYRNAGMLQYDVSFETRLRAIDEVITSRH